MEALFEAFGIDWKLLLIQVVNFGVLMLALWHFLYKPVMKMLEERQKLVEKGVLEAQKAEELFAGAAEEVSQQLGRAEEEASHIVHRAREAASEERTRLVKEAEARAEAIEKDAAARAAETTAQTMRESQKDIARLAILAAGKALKEKHD